MESMWKLNLDDYVPVNTPPEEIVKQQCNYLGELTNGRVIAKVSNYKGKTSGYTKKSLNALIKKATGDYEEEVDIQEDLGDLGNVPDMYFAYEFYLTSPSTPKYKFRIMFFSYVKDQYPITLMLDDDIAADIFEMEKVVCTSEDAFNGYLVKILNSKKVTSVIRALNSISEQNENLRNEVVPT